MLYIGPEYYGSPGKILDYSGGANQATARVELLVGNPEPAFGRPTRTSRLVRRPDPCVHQASSCSAPTCSTTRRTW